MKAAADPLNHRPNRKVVEIVNSGKGCRRRTNTNVELSDGTICEKLAAHEALVHDRDRLAPRSSEKRVVLPLTLQPDDVALPPHGEVVTRQGDNGAVGAVLRVADQMLHPPAIADVRRASPSVCDIRRPATIDAGDVRSLFVQIEHVAMPVRPRTGAQVNHPKIQGPDTALKRLVVGTEVRGHQLADKYTSRSFRFLDVRENAARQGSMPFKACGVELYEGAI